MWFYSSPDETAESTFSRSSKVGFSTNENLWSEKTELLWKICGPIILILGIPGNILTFLVLNTFKEKTTATRFFQALAVTDLACLCVGCLQSWIGYQFGSFPQNANKLMCIFERWWGYSLGMQSVNFIVVITVHRVLAIAQPLLVRVLCTKQRGYHIIAFVVFVSFAFNMYIPLVTQYKNNKCDWSAEFRKNSAMNMRVVNAFFFSIIPILIIICSNSYFIWKLRISGRTTTAVRSVDAQKKRTRATLTVAVVSIAFIVLTLPKTVMQILYQNNPDLFGNRNRFNYYRQIALLLMYLNSAVNFLCYTWAGELFRMHVTLYFKSLWHCLSCCYKSNNYTNPKQADVYEATHIGVASVGTSSQVRAEGSA